MFGEMFVGFVIQIQYFTQKWKTKFIFEPDQTLPNTAKQMLWDQTSPTFHQAFVFEMLGEMFDLFDRGLIHTNV